MNNNKIGDLRNQLDRRKQLIDLENFLKSSKKAIVNVKNSLKISNNTFEVSFFFLLFCEEIFY